MDRFYFAILIASVLLFAACGGSSDATQKDTTVSQDTGTPADAVVGDDTGLEDTSLQEDTLLTDSSLTDTFVPEDLQTEDVVQASDLSEDFLDSVCWGYCYTQYLCVNENVDMGTCEDECRVQAVADKDYLLTVTCLSMAYNDSDEDFSCDFLNTCADVASIDGCVELCQEAIPDCGWFGSESEFVLGVTAAECTANCVGFGTLNPEGIDDILVCMISAAESCESLEFYECLANDDAEMCQDFCSEWSDASECGLIPGRWETDQACLEECQTWTLGQSLAAMICVEMVSEQNQNEDGDVTEACFADADAKCFPPMDEPPAGSETLCTVMKEKCPDIGADAFSLPADICAWFMAGFVQAGPSWFTSDLVSASECISAWQQCPEGEDAWLTCMMEIWESAPMMCEKVYTCLEEIDQLPDNTMDECLVQVTTLHGEDPVSLEAAAECIDNGADCTAILACVPTDN